MTTYLRIMTVTVILLLLGVHGYATPRTLPGTINQKRSTPASATQKIPIIGQKQSPIFIPDDGVTSLSEISVYEGRIVNEDGSPAPSVSFYVHYVPNTHGQRVQIMRGSYPMNTSPDGYFKFALVSQDSVFQNIEIRSSNDNGSTGRSGETFPLDREKFNTIISRKTIPRLPVQLLKSNGQALNTTDVTLLIRGPHNTNSEIGKLIEIASKPHSIELVLGDKSSSTTFYAKDVATSTSYYVRAAGRIFHSERINEGDRLKVFNEVTKTFSLRGLVEDPTGKPIHGATVLLGRSSWVEFGIFEIRHYKVSELEKIWTKSQMDFGQTGFYKTATDANGYYEIRGNSADSTSFLTIQATSYNGYTFRPFAMYESGLVGGDIETTTSVLIPTAKVKFTMVNTSGRKTIPESMIGHKSSDDPADPIYIGVPSVVFSIQNPFRSSYWETEVNTVDGIPYISVPANVPFDLVWDAPKAIVHPIYKISISTALPPGEVRDLGTLIWKPNTTNAKPVIPSDRTR